MLDTPCSGHDNMPESPCLGLPDSFVAASPWKKSCSWACCFLIQNNQSVVHTPQPSPLLGSHTLDHFTLVLITPDRYRATRNRLYAPESAEILQTTQPYIGLPWCTFCRNRTKALATAPPKSPWAMLTQGIHRVSLQPCSKVCTVLGSMHIINYFLNHICLLVLVNWL